MSRTSMLQTGRTGSRSIASTAKVDSGPWPRRMSITMNPLAPIRAARIRWNGSTSSSSFTAISTGSTSRWSVPGGRAGFVGRCPRCREWIRFTTLKMEALDEGARGPVSAASRQLADGGPVRVRPACRMPAQRLSLMVGARPLPRTYTRVAPQVCQLDDFAERSSESMRILGRHQSTTAVRKSQKNSVQEDFSWKRIEIA